MSWFCVIPFAASLLAACGEPPPLAVGYVEGEYVLLAPTEIAQIRSVEVRRGDHVEPGAELVRLEDEDARLAVAEGRAALAQAEAELADLRQGQRPEEIAVLEAALRSAEAEMAEAQRVVERTADLRRRGIATQAELDRAETAGEQAAAAVGQAKANLVVARLPAREDDIASAEAQVEQARIALKQAEWRLGERVLKAPAAARVDDVIRSAGDVAGPSAPVLSLLPEGAVKLKLYVPEPAFSSIEAGMLLDVRCDGCAPDLRARVSYLSPEPEFTPPVIYSLETRQKLVHLVEARPLGEARDLKPGQIVDVRLGSRQSAGRQSE